MTGINLATMFLGGVISLVGVGILHFLDKTYSFIIRAGTVLLICLGLSLIWNELAKKVPVVINTELEFFSQEESIIILKGSYDVVRNCRLKDYVTEIKFEDNSIYKVDMNYFSVNTEQLNKNKAYFFLKPPTDKTSLLKSIEINAIYECAFGIQVINRFPAVVVKDLFKSHDL